MKTRHKISDEKNSMAKHNLEINQNSNFFKKSNMLVNIHNKRLKKVVESGIIPYHNTIKRGLCLFFQLISLFSQISAKKLQYPLFKRQPVNTSKRLPQTQIRYCCSGI